MMLAARRSSSDRPNLRISVARKKALASDLRPLLDRLAQGDQGSTIVYVPTVKDAVTVSGFIADQLREHGIDCRCYHGSLSLQGVTASPLSPLNLTLARVSAADSSPCARLSFRSARADGRNKHSNFAKTLQLSPKHSNFRRFHPTATSF